MKDTYKKITAFTLAEIMVVFMIIAVISAATIGIQRSRNRYAMNFMSYAVFTNMRAMVSELIAIGCSTTLDGECGVNVPASLPRFANIDAGPATGLGFCNRLVDMLNISGTPNCSRTANDSGPFTAANANFTTTNGIRYFNFGSDPEYINLVADPGYVIGELTSLDYANEIYTVYIDSDGARGTAQLGQDVTKFYISRDGSTVLPDAESAMATNIVNGEAITYLTTAVRFRTGGNITTLLNGVSFQEAACKADSVATDIVPDLFKAAPYNYCAGIILGEDAVNTTCQTETCEILINKPGF